MDDIPCKVVGEVPPVGGGKLTLAGAIVQTVFLLAVFIPFSYFMDRMVWRSHQKRLAKNSSR